jgi:hypothetical protein
MSLADAIALGAFVTVVESVGGLGAGDALAFFALLDLPEALTGDGFVCCHGSRLVSGLKENGREFEGLRTTIFGNPEAAIDKLPFSVFVWFCHCVNSHFRPARLEPHHVSRLGRPNLLRLRGLGFGWLCAGLGGQGAAGAAMTLIFCGWCAYGIIFVLSRNLPLVVSQNLVAVHPRLILEQGAVSIRQLFLCPILPVPTVACGWDWQSPGGWGLR